VTDSFSDNKEEFAFCKTYWHNEQ